MSFESEQQLLKDRANPEYAQARGHNKRVRDRYPEAWAKSVITDKVLAEWIVANKEVPCTYCDSPVKEVDHMVPLSKGGDHTISNLQMLCMDCNRSKHDMTDEEFAAFRKNAPKIGLSLKDYGIDYRVLKDKMNRFRTQSLFKELVYLVTNKDLTPLFTLRGEEDVDGFISLKRIYLTIGDPTEYKFAKAVFGDYRHWRTLCMRPWFQPYVKEWRSELKAKIRADAVEALIAMKDDNLQAIKALANEEYAFASYINDEPRKRKVGRPNKEVKPEIEDEVFEGDAARLGLNG